MNAPPLAHLFPRALHLTVSLSVHAGPSEAIAWYIRLGQHLSGFDLALVVRGHTAAVLATDRALTVHDRRVLVNWLIEQPELSVARIRQLPPAAVIPAITRRPTNTALQENDHA